jgi:hypothetical protein
LKYFGKLWVYLIYEAQDIIHNSKTWSDVKDSDDKIIDIFFDIIEESDELEET